MHEWCDPKWCQYLQAAANGQTFDHSKSSIPRSCLDMIKPAFDELCSRDSLERVVGGGSQNVNEAFHSLLLTMHHSSSSTVMVIYGVQLVCVILSLGLILLTISNMPLKIVELTSINNEQRLEEYNYDLTWNGYYPYSTTIFYS
ncbi:unnamed protein product [Adineta steineri]|uniref:Uncharacterized protein n=1 Tax=Adineta steineri TaxID=433720 RepID=A0A819MNX1_9BILA|nr:unnamed protein product [Adineta steineri]